jgi:hypothetical protein
MKQIIIINSKNYPELVAIISTNSFGDQRIEYIKEHVDGQKETIMTFTNHEGDHWSSSRIISMGLCRLPIYSKKDDVK